MILDSNSQVDCLKVGQPTGSKIRQSILVAFISTTFVAFSAHSNPSEAVTKSEGHEATAPTDEHSPEAQAIHKNHLRHEKVKSVMPIQEANLSKSRRPAKPELLNPSYGQKVQWPVTLEWKPVEGADSYFVQVATDAHFRSIVFEKTFVKEGTSIEVKEIKDASHFYWRVFAQTSGNKPSHMKSFYAWSIFDINN